ncbi:unnamed protein product [Symbiodinium microadriaticum]|nr:unnamed protein product [Symbiodinium microadriaticum]
MDALVNSAVNVGTTNWIPVSASTAGVKRKREFLWRLTKKSEINGPRSRSYFRAELTMLSKTIGIVPAEGL